MEQGNHRKGALKRCTQAYVVTTALLLIAALGSSKGYAADHKIHFNIPASNVTHALLEFSHQAKLQILFTHPDQLALLNTTAVIGEYSCAEALAVMLQGVPVAFEFYEDYTDRKILVRVPPEWDSSPPLASIFTGASSSWATANAALLN